MKQRHLLGCIAFVSISIYSVPPTPDSLITKITPRSQELNRPLQMVGACESTHIIDKGPFYATLSAAGFYNKSFRSNTITRALFGKSLQCSGSSDPYLHIQGSSYVGNNRDPIALLADYFYLPRDYDGRISFEPSIENGGVDLDLYFGLNDMREGLYFRIHSAIVHSRWNLGIREKITTLGTLPYPPGYFTPDFLHSNQLLERFTQYGCGQSPLCGAVSQDLSQIIVNTPVNPGNGMQGVLTTYLDPLKYAKLCCSESKTRLSDIRLELGQIIKEQDDYHIGTSLQLVIPTGTKTHARLLFEPTIGNGHHWELGGGFHAHYRMHHNEEKDAHASLYTDFTITHLFSNRQSRTFDLKNKPLSRYMLASYLTAGSAQFDKEYAPVANISTLDVNVKVSIQIDLTALVHYHKKQWDFDLGYNLWFRSREHIKKRASEEHCPDALCDATAQNRWVLKGDARMYGFNYDEDTGLIGEISPLGVSENDATIYQGTNNSLFDCSTDDTNIRIDNPVTLGTTPAPTPLPLLTVYPCPSASGAGPYIKTSNPPIFISCCDLDIRELKCISHKIFANGSYAWNWHDTNLFIGLGGSAEFGEVDRCEFLFSPSSWEVWLKTGVTFD